MNNDIFFLGNSNVFSNKKINKYNDYKSFIEKDKQLILSHFNDNLTNKYENELLKKAFFNYIQEIQNIKNFLDEVNNNIKSNYSQKDIETMDKAFLKLKKNKQQTIMDCFNNNSNNNSSQPKKISIYNQMVDKDNLNLFNNIEKIDQHNDKPINLSKEKHNQINTNKKDDKNIKKTIDLTNEI